MGYWISPGGDIHPNDDHWNYLRSHPKLFGRKKTEVDRWTLGDRERTLTETILHGWIRVRGTSPNLAFEINVLDQDTLARIKGFLLWKKGVTPHEKIMIDEMGPSKVWYEPADWVFKDEALTVAANKKRR